jgi:hypothetical protein
MTVETRTTIEPTDVTAIELECVECHHRIVRNLRNWRNDPAKCDNCGNAWNVGDAMKQLQELCSRIRYFSEMTTGHPFVIRFEIAKAEAEEKKS